MPSLFTLVRALIGITALSSRPSAASLQTVTNWGENPSDISTMQIYVPDKLAANPPIILGLHPCGGTGQMYYGMTKLPKYADSIGFILIYPTTTKETNCRDCHSNKTLTHEGGGDSQGLVNMVKYALNKYNGDPTKVFAVGGSSGAMMTNVLAATYPDVFNAGASWSGGPGRLLQWGDIARGCYPGYSGNRTRMIIAHGTADPAVLYSLLGMQLAQWSNVLGVSFSKNMTNTPAQGWTEMIYGDGSKLVGLSLQGGGHIPRFQEEKVLKFFGLM
ncbi:uncharacterized protein BP5553_10625 [Venustampulla echinocandica]|uniref:Uncharacterized protein n=1 Tax=Venustampulla echinocandica TaxID=2656787 RepID=A0A370T931_9HELO|nr:uncharacterized protein BP5553_10625 [Venustampulla echinocandica]RDL29998.1 hypothetical protein BP5553_10625 [Venustampulla echinocandica]